MDNKMLKKVIIKTLHEYGLLIDKIITDKSTPVFYISVPEYSCEKTTDGIDIANRYLAEKFKETICNIFNADSIVKMKIRKNEFWTKEMKEKVSKEFDNLYNEEVLF